MRLIAAARRRVDGGVTRRDDRPAAATPSLRVCALLAALALGSRPLLATADTLLVVRKAADAISFIDPGSGAKLASVPVAHAPHEVGRAPDGRLAAISNYGTRDRPGATLSIVDLEHPRELRRLALGGWRRPHGVVWYAPDRIAVTTEDPAGLTIVDPRAGRIVAQIATDQAGSHMVAVTPDHALAFVTNLAAGSTSVIDLADGRKLRDVPTGRGSEAVAVTADGGEVWVAAREAGTLTVFDARTHAVRATMPLAGAPIRIAMAGDVALVSCAASGEIVAFDVRERREVGRRRIEGSASPPGAPAGARRTPAGAVPVGMTVAADGRSVFVAATALDRILQLALPALTVERAIDVAGEPDGMALTTLIPQALCHACEAPADPLALGEQETP
jgi:DNA-binding beta-propeller fold protein YncE